MNTPNFHIIKVSFLGTTNFRGSRVKLYSERFKKGKVINYDYAFNSTLDFATYYLTKKGFQVIGKGEGKDHYYIISTTFESL